MLNKYLLLKEVHNRKEIEVRENSDTKEKSFFRHVLLFGSLCMQMAYGEIYKYLEMDTEEDTLKTELFENLLGENGDNVSFVGDKVLKDIINKMDNEEAKNVKRFLEEFVAMIQKENGTETNVKEVVDELKEMMELTSATAVSVGNEKSRKGVRYEKVYEEEFKQCTLEEGQVKTFNSCKVEWYQIDNGEKKTSSSFADFFVDALAYAYEENEEKFLEIKKKAEENKDASFRRLFVIEENKNTTSKEIPGTGIHVSTYSNNNDKVKQIQRIYKALGLECSCIKISLKEARTVK